MKEIDKRELMLVESLRRIACSNYPDTRDEMIDFAVETLREWRVEIGYKTYPTPTKEVKAKLDKYNREDNSHEI